MKKEKTLKQPKITKSEDASGIVLKLKKEISQDDKEESSIHSLGNGIICDTEARGFTLPQGRSPLEIVVDASEGFIPLWAKDTVLRWRFRERSFTNFENSAAIKKEVRILIGQALLAWGDAAPVKFTENDDVWDFEIVLKQGDDCNASGCVLASAFFPDPGRHELEIYPKMFVQPKSEQVDTLIHEIGHVFGLRHFFAKISEAGWKSEIFGKHSKFSIMNYGELSKLTVNDKKDLKKLYQLVWTGEMKEINGTPIRLVKPYHSGVNTSKDIFATVQDNHSIQV